MPRTIPAPGDRVRFNNGELGTVGHVTTNSRQPQHQDYAQVVYDSDQKHEFVSLAKFEWRDEMVEWRADFTPEAPQP